MCLRFIFNSDQLSENYSVKLLKSLLPKHLENKKNFGKKCCAIFPLTVKRKKLG
jgi:hypothetical protein